MSKITKKMLLDILATGLTLFLLLYYGFTLDLLTSVKVGFLGLLCGVVLAWFSRK